MKRIISCFLCIFLLGSNQLLADPSNVEVAVWGNEAIIATYTYDYKNFLERQKKIAQYFTANAWIAYSAALTKSGLPTRVKANRYQVSAVATLPPTVKNIEGPRWRVTMPILVLYKNPQYQQKQYLKVSIDVVKAKGGRGIRGFAIIGLNATATSNPCHCQKIIKKQKNKSQAQ